MGPFDMDDGVGPTGGQARLAAAVRAAVDVIEGTGDPQPWRPWWGMGMSEPNAILAGQVALNVITEKMERKRQLGWVTIVEEREGEMIIWMRPPRPGEVTGEVIQEVTE